MLLTNGSIVVPNDDDNLMIENSNPFVLELVRDPPDSVKVTDSSPKSSSKLPGKQKLLAYSCLPVRVLRVNRLI